MVRSTVLLFATLFVLPYELIAQQFIWTTPAGCGNAAGAAYLEPGGPSPYTIVWSPEPGGGQGTFHATGFPPGTHSVSVTNGLGVTETTEFTIEAIPGLFTTELVADHWFTCHEDCDGNMSYVLYDNGPHGQEPYSFTAAPELEVSFSSCCLEVWGMCEGPGYEVVVTDALGCSSTLTVGPVEVAYDPVLLSESVIPSCPGGATGSTQLLFNSPVELWNDSLEIYFPLATLHVIQGLAPGSYEWFAAAEFSWCLEELFFTTTIEEAPSGCGTITGTLYADLDDDCEQDPADPGIPYRTIALSPIPEELVITSADGTYERGRLLGTHFLMVQEPNLDPLCPATLPVAVDLVQDNEVVVRDIALTPTLGADLSVHHMAMNAAPGFEIPYWVTVRNDGPYAQEGPELQFSFATLQSVISTSEAPSFSSPGHLSWDLPEMPPFSTWQVNMVLQLVPDPELIGDTITMVSTIIPTTPDADPDNDQRTTDVPITGAYDPNDKRAWTSSGMSDTYYLPAYDEYIDYTIRFQNTGNAPAQHVFVIDTISPLLDATSLHITGASHYFEVQWQQERALRFDFPGIMLADSVNNEPESHGFISYRVKPAPSITIGDLLMNAADIFFDFNPPIRTNNAVLLVNELTNVDDHTGFGALQVIPNPAREQLRVIGHDLSGTSWQVIGVDGRHVLNGSATMDVPLIDLDGLSPGVYLLRMIGLNGLAGQVKFVKE